MEFSQKANEVKEEFIKYISDKEKEYKGVDAKKRKEFNKYADKIKLLDFGLAEKFAVTVNDTICVGINKDRPILVKETMLTCFNEYLSESPEELFSIDDSFPFSFKRIIAG